MLLSHPAPLRHGRPTIHEDGRWFGLARLAVVGAVVLFISASPPVLAAPATAVAFALLTLIAAVSVGQLCGVGWLRVGRLAPVAIDVAAVLAVLALYSPQPRYLFSLVLLVQVEAAITLGLRGGLATWAVTTLGYAGTELLGEPAGALAGWSPITLRGVTGLVITLAALRLAHDVQQHQRRLDELIAGVDAVLWEADLEGHLTFPAAAGHVLGQSAARWRDTPQLWVTAADAADQTDLAAIWEAVAEHGEPRQWEQRLRTPDGDSLWIRAGAHRTSDLRGRLGVRGVFVDVTRFKRAQTRLAELGQINAVVAETNQMLLRATGRDELFEGACRIAVVRGGMDLARIHLFDDEGTLVERASFGEERSSAEATGRFPLRVGEDEVGTFSVHADRRFDPDEVELLGGMADNISYALGALGADEELRRLNTELEARVEERTAALASANRDLEAFAYSVSHDLRAPLRAVDGFSRMLVEDHEDELSDDAQRVLDTIRASTKRMGLLIDGLLRFSRAGRTALTIAEIDMDSLVRSVAEEQLHAHADLEVELDVGPLGTAHGDATLVRQVWANLIGNALKFTRGRPSPRVEIRRTESDGPACYRISDNGVGFDQAYVGRLFGVFQRLHKASEYDGEGVGLAIVQRIVQRHGGRVLADGRSGAGATFTFTLDSRDST